MTVKIRQKLILALSVFVLIAPLGAQADRIQEKPNGAQMTADLVLARPIGLAMLGVGTGVYLVTLPLSLLGGNAGDAGNQLVVEPAKEVFVRCLGCKQPGRKEKIAER